MKRSPLLVVFITVFLDLVGFGIIIPLLPFYAEHFGTSPTFIGFFSGSFSLMQFIFAPLWGRLSDRVGRRPILLLGIAGTVVSMLVFGFALNKWMLLASRMLAGIAGANISAAQAYIADVTTPQNRAKGMGIIGAAFGLGFIFGPAIGGVMATYGEAVPAFFAAGLALVNLLLALFLLPESLSPALRAQAKAQAAVAFNPLTRIWKQGFSHPQVGALLVLFLLVVLAFANLEATFALFTQRRLGFRATQVGYVFAYIGVIATVVQGGLMGRLSKAFGESRLLITGVALLGFGLGSMPLVHNVPELIVAVTFSALGNSFFNPSVSALVSKYAGSSGRGTLLGIQQSLGALGRMVGPPLGGFLFQTLNEDAPYYAGALILCAGFVIALTTRSHGERAAAGEPR